MFELTNSSYKFSLYKNLYSTDKPENEIDINQLVEIVKYDYLKKEIGILRQVESKEEYNNLKKSTLPAVTLSGIFGHRNKEGFKKHSGLIQIDIDHIQNYDSAFSSIIQDDYTYVAFKSPGGNGIKVIVKINKLSETHLSQFYALETYYKETFDITIDSACKDVARTMLLSYDPDLYCNPHSDIFEVLEDRSNRKKIAKKTKWKKYNNLNYKKYYTKNKDEKVIDRIAEEILRNKIDITYTYKNWISVAFSIINTLGENGREYFHKISSNHDDYKYEKTDKLYSDLLDKNNGGNSIGTLIYLAGEYGIEIVKHDYYVNPDKVYEKLRKVRSEIARNNDKPAFTVFSNKVLNQLVHNKPKTIDDLINIKGIGIKKVNDYGDAILEVINSN